MKKYAILSTLLLLCLALLCGCGEEAGATQPQAVAADIPLYYNLDFETDPAPDANGVYTFNFVTGTEKKALTVTDQALAEQLVLLDFMGLELDGERITGIIRMPDMPYSRKVWNYYVQSIGGNAVKFNELASYVGADITLKLPEGMPVYDLDPNTANFAAPTQLKKNDCVTIIADANGELLYGYVTSRPAVPHEGLLYCRHCDKEVEWMDWNSSNSLPAGDGHFLLTSDVTVSRETQVGNVKLCLDLNGKTVSQSSFGLRIYSLRAGGTMSIMDSVGTGTFLPNTSDATGLADRGLVIMVSSDNSTLNLYGGTLDGRNSTAMTATVVSIKSGTFNMYDGTILGGTSYGVGASAVTANGIFNMYGGKIVGGKHIAGNFGGGNPPAGGALRVLGTTTIYGGTIEGGDSHTKGGVIHLASDAKEAGVVKLILKGGTITGGTAPVAGGIYAANFSTIEISGDVQITGNENGNLMLSTYATLLIGPEGLGKNAKIGICMENDGVFLLEAPEGAKINKHFFADEAGKRIVKSGKSWEIK